MYVLKKQYAKNVQKLFQRLSVSVYDGNVYVNGCIKSYAMRQVACRYGIGRRVACRGGVLATILRHSSRTSSCSLCKRLHVPSHVIYCHV